MSSVPFHPFRRLMKREVGVAGFVVLFFVSWAILLLIVTLILDGQLSNDVTYGSFEFAFSATSFAESKADLNAEEQQQVALSGGLHFLNVFVNFTATSFIAAWAANQLANDTIGNIITWAQTLLGTLFGVIGHSIVCANLANATPSTSNGPYVAAGLFLALQDAVLAVGVLFGVTVVVWKRVSRRSNDSFGRSNDEDDDYQAMTHM